MIVHRYSRCKPLLFAPGRGGNVDDFLGKREQVAAVADERERERKQTSFSHHKTGAPSTTAAAWMTKVPAKRPIAPLDEAARA